MNGTNVSNHKSIIYYLLFTQLKHQKSCCFLYSQSQIVLSAETKKYFHRHVVTTQKSNIANCTVLFRLEMCDVFPFTLRLCCRLRLWVLCFLLRLQLAYWFKRLLILFIIFFPSSDWVVCVCLWLIFGCIEDVSIATIEICKVFPEFNFKVVFSTTHMSIGICKTGEALERKLSGLVWQATRIQPKITLVWTNLTSKNYNV